MAVTYRYVVPEAHSSMTKNHQYHRQQQQQHAGMSRHVDWLTCEIFTTQSATSSVCCSHTLVQRLKTRDLSSRDHQKCRDGQRKQLAFHRSVRVYSTKHQRETLAWCHDSRSHTSQQSSGTAVSATDRYATDSVAADVLAPVTWLYLSPVLLLLLLLLL